METTAILHKIRDRSLDQHDLNEIRQIVADHWNQGRAIKGVSVVLNAMG